MSEAKEQNNKPSNDKDAEPTRFLDDSVLGLGGQVGSFRIEQELGRGAAGVVYLAHDTKLGRLVAIKSLPVELVQDTTARMRFVREARALASLNHPNIATIYEELQEAGGVGYLVLEYVPGQTLAERLAGVRLKLQEALPIAQQIAEAIAAAHERGIIHRDLKPGNIKITPEGRIKVLDFGLAKALRSDAVDQPSTVTELGRVVGTPAYMSPEQARGLETDERCDIWSFGCVLYQMLTGDVPFKGETVSDTLACILDREPDWQALPQATPANIQVLLRRCLEKDPRRRLHDIADAAIEINETLNLPAIVPPVTTLSVPLTPQIAVEARSPRIAMVVAAAIIIVLCVIAVWFILRQRGGLASEQIRLVVLPFENLGPKEEEYFADGITEAISARLAGIHGLGVISHQSAMQYRKQGTSPQVIGKELNVDYVLQGTVWSERPSDPSGRVRIIPKLIRTSDDMQVWAATYDDDMSEVFRVQSDVAERVAQELNIALVEGEQRALRSRPTENMEAYDYFLRGNDYCRRSYLPSNFGIAIRMYEKAVRLDPKFASAYAQLSRCHATMYWDYDDHTLGRLKMARYAVEKALELEPDLPEAHLAQGYCYYCQSDWDDALNEFALARKSLPNDSDLLSLIGYVQRRQGNFMEALKNIENASKLDPRSINITIDLGETFMWMRNYQEAMNCFNRAVSLHPDEARPYGYMASLHLLWKGNTKKARAVLNKALGSETIGSQARSFIIDSLIDLDVYEGKYQKALDQLTLIGGINNQDSFIPAAMRYARIYRYKENGLAKKSLMEKYEEARSILEAKIRQDPNDARFHSSLGITYAGLGRSEEAIREGKKGVELLPLTKDAMRGVSSVEASARIYVMVGEFDLAIDQIEMLLSRPSELSIPLLRLDPAWNPLRNRPRFKKLLEGK
jgi:eukaryotic-like serine/threonine-protein kinase